ncbi:hypothetical protein CPX_001807 [Candidatus Phytoplasma pruni]|uniref:Uncharacterized protein n=1 Tax=Candidatus Phytoplasma pruni TaxID=479893 RepID=A0A0M1MZA5_9MOLU|nr:hypothetical protein [Candidatus Phytoplasma pruni]KOR75233.1 hypothetical protein CPX_001807 [Candidatus Phytoplasma pruni]
MIFNLSVLKYLISFDFKALFYLLYSIFYSIFLTKSSFLFGYEVGWNINFFNIFNFIKMIVIFIWEKLTILIYPLKLFNSLFGFLIDILNFFKDIFSSLFNFIKSNISSLTAQKLMNPDEGLWEKLKEICKIIFTVTVGGSVIYFFKEMQTFLLNSFIKIGDLLFKIVLRILDIMVIVLNIWLLLLKKIIIILGFIFSFLMNVVYLCAYEEKE